MSKILVIQTAFIGDVVLATALVEKLHRHIPTAQIDFLVRKGNESLLDNNPHIREVLIWNKKESKTKNLFKLIGRIRKNEYDYVINLHRFFSTGLMVVFSGAKEKIGFDKNPLSFLFTKKVKHEITGELPFKHEVDRNQSLISHFTDGNPALPKLYPGDDDRELIKKYTIKSFITITPSSVWFTKQYPMEKWIEFIQSVPAGIKIFLLGGKENISDCEKIVIEGKVKNVEILAGQLSFLQSTALMEKAKMNYVNDSAPLHFASAINAPVTAIFCSTIPAFGFTPLSETSFIVEVKEQLSCRPCGLHGKRQCPLGHFKCGNDIENDQLLKTLEVL